MTRHAFIAGGSGQIGLAVAHRLAQDGWHVRIGSRTPPPSGPWRHVPYDREEPGALNRAFGRGADLLLDCVAFDAGHARQLLSVAGGAGRIAAISSASVYRDARGRTLDEADRTGFPEMPVPIPEDHPTVTAGPETYSTRKIAMENTLRGADIPVTILRPCAIHGARSKHAREWWFVKRLRDGRRRIPLARMGASRFQTTSAAAIAETVAWACGGNVPEIVNVRDADAPDVAAIGRTIMAHLGLQAELVPLPDEPGGTLGQTPWSTRRPFICDSSAPDAGRYCDTVGPALDWLMTLPLTGWRNMLPQLAAYTRDHFDYATEDTALGRGSRVAGRARRL